MNLLTKKTPWLIAMLLAATATFGEEKCRNIKEEKCRNAKLNNNDDACRPKKSFEQGQKLQKDQMMPGYNSPARIDVRGSWDIFVQGSFIYWQLLQDNMEVAFSDTLANTAYTTNSQVQGNYVPLDFKYVPGFKLGLGLNMDHDSWDFYAQYTQLHAKNHTSTDSVFTATGALAPLFPTWGHPFIQGTNVYNSGSEHWGCNLDIGEIDLGRVYYAGTHLTFRPDFGLRAAWIGQHVQVQYVNADFSNVTPSEVPGTATIVQRSHSWAVGPKAGIDTNWILGCGVRLYGNASADVLFTRYKLQNKTDFLANAGSHEFFISKEHVSALRTHYDLELGLGWGSYFDNNNWHIDLSASYGFQVFCDQNLFARFQDNAAAGCVIQPMGNLYAQGLTTNLRFDF